MVGDASTDERHLDPGLGVLVLSILSVIADIASIGAAKRSLIDEPRREQEQITDNIRTQLRDVRNHTSNLIELNVDFSDLIDQISGHNASRYWGELMAQQVFVFMNLDELRRYTSIKTQADANVCQIKARLNGILSQLIATNHSALEFFIELQDEAEAILSNAFSGKLTYGEANDRCSEFLQRFKLRLREWGGNRL